MVNIMAFKIHNKYKYFIHFPKKPYLCKTNKQDRTMNNLLTHYPINWIDGMKLSSSHFIAVQDFVTDSLRDAIMQQQMQLNKRSTYEVLQILGISLIDKTPIKDLFNKTTLKDDKEHIEAYLPTLF